MHCVSVFFAFLKIGMLSENKVKSELESLSCKVYLVKNKGKNGKGTNERSEAGDLTEPSGDKAMLRVLPLTSRCAIV